MSVVPAAAGIRSVAHCLLSARWQGVTCAWQRSGPRPVEGVFDPLFLIYDKKLTLTAHTTLELGAMVSTLRKSTTSLLGRLSKLMDSADMHEVASLLGVSLATAYRYRKAPSEMSVAAFEHLAAHFHLPVSMNLVYREDNVLAAEESRLRLEEEVAQSRGARFVATQHFTANCETESFTRELFQIQYGDRFSNAEVEEYVSLRMRRRKLYLSGLYSSEEIINGPSYIDFFYGRGLFEQLNKHVRLAQLEEVVNTAVLPHVTRKIYVKATPELPVILNYSVAKSIIRVEDLTMLFTDEDCDEANRVLRSYADEAAYDSRDAVRSFLLNPLNPHQ